MAGTGVWLALVLCAVYGVAWAEEHWVHNGYGSPLPSHAAFTRVGATCPDGSLVVGMSFSRGGCKQTGVWTDHSQQPADSANCAGDADLDSEEGLYVELDCRTGAVPVFQGQWTAVGVGTPLAVHGDFSLVGASCPPGRVLTGVRFDTGGCGLNATSWEEGTLDYNTCTNEEDDVQGLVMEVQCAVYYIVDDVVATWKETGVGYPLATHADFERVGGECPEGEVAQGIAFRKGGYGLAGATEWRQGELSFPPNPHQGDALEGLVLRLLCAAPNMTGVVPASPDPPRPSAVHSLLCTYMPSASTYPVEDLLFEFEAAQLMDIFTNQVEVQSSSIKSGIVRVFFLVYGPTSACDQLIELVATQDEAVEHTYFGTRSCVVDYYTSSSPDSTMPPSRTPSPAPTPSALPSTVPVTDSNSSGSPSTGSPSTGSSLNSPASPDSETGSGGGDDVLLWAAVAAAASSGTAVLALVVLTVLVIGALVVIRRKEQQPYEGISANFGEEPSRLGGEDDELAL